MDSKQTVLGPIVPGCGSIPLEALSSTTSVSARIAYPPDAGLLYLGSPRMFDLCLRF